MLSNIEEILERKLNGFALEISEKDDSEFILGELFLLGSKYAKQTGNHLILKCQSPTGQSILLYNSSPTQNTKKHAEKKTQPVEHLSENLSAQEKSERARRLNDIERVRINKIFRHLALERCKNDLKDPQLTCIPRSRINVIGWPSDIRESFSPSVRDCKILIKLVKVGKLKFEWKGNWRTSKSKKKNLANSKVF